ncbi:hypothetical protein [Kytococcus sedentarius]|uniref:hypothetical protein n=1 Tax=Kytococcus sedentarius TaxID=1276 RepID=UPI00384C99DD
MPTIARAENVAYVDREDEVVVALLPSGPLRILQGPTVVVWDLIGEGALERDELVAQVLASYGEYPPEAPDQLSEAIDLLLAEGFLTA